MKRSSPRDLNCVYCDKEVSEPSNSWCFNWRQALSSISIGMKFRSMPSGTTVPFMRGCIRSYGEHAKVNLTLSVTLPPPHNVYSSHPSKAFSKSLTTSAIVAFRIFGEGTIACIGYSFARSRAA